MNRKKISSSSRMTRAVTAAIFFLHLPFPEGTASQPPKIGSEFVMMDPFPAAAAA
jgi:hypothetical protein